MAKKSSFEKHLNRKTGGLKRSLKSKAGLRKNSKGCLLLLFIMISSIGLLSFI
jgi:hypothetical protein